MLREILMIGSLLSVSLTGATENPGTEVGSVVRLSPSVRSLQENRFEATSCEQLSSVQAETEQEQRQLHERKQQCLQHYQSFIPATGLR